MLQKMRWALFALWGASLGVQATGVSPAEGAAESPVEAAAESPAEHTAVRPQGGLYMEINKLEQRDDLCVAYVRFSNHSETEFSEFKSELFAFDKEDVITAHFLADFQQVMANKTVVKLVPMKDTRCSEVGSVLLNRMTECKSGDQEVADCLRRLSIGSKGSVKLFK
jgi:hypothetical protein